MRRSLLLLGIAFTMVLSSALIVSAQRHQAPRSGNISGGRPVFGGWRAAPPVTRSVPVTRPPHAPPPRAASNGTIHGTPYYRGTTHYENPRTYNQYYAHHPNMYRGSWVYTGGRRWYNGYWHSYWSNANWAWFNGFYGFWFPLNFGNVFVYEAAPGVCQYWDGYQWIPYYDPASSYYCPY